MLYYEGQLATLNYRFKSSLVKEVRTKLDSQGRDKDLNLRWIPGERNTLSNEEGNVLAKHTPNAY